MTLKCVSLCKTGHFIKVEYDLSNVLKSTKIFLSLRLHSINDSSYYILLGIFGVSADGQIYENIYILIQGLREGCIDSY